MDFTSKNRWESSEFLQKHVTPILAPVMEKVLLQRPDDIASFFAKQFASQAGRTISSPTKTTKKQASDENGVEMDTTDSENLSDDDLWALLLPDGTMPGLSHPTVTKFSISYSCALLSGWVKQRSPGCAAASVAGAFNALRDLHRDDPGALSMDDVIGVLCDIQRERAEKKRGRVERFLLGASLEPLSVALRAFIFQHHDGKTLAGENKKTCCGKKLRNATLKKLVFMRRKGTPSENVASDSNSDKDDGSHVTEVIATKECSSTSQSESKYGTEEDEEEEYDIATRVSSVPKEEWIHRAPVFEQIRELIEMKERETETQAAANVSAAAAVLEGTGGGGGEENEDDDDDNDDEGEREEENPAPSSSGRSSSSSSSTSDFNWFKEVAVYFEIQTGLEKLQRKKPSTAAFGNWGIVAGVREAGAADETGHFKCSYFMGRAPRGSKLVRHRLAPPSSSKGGHHQSQEYEMELERTWQLLKLEHSHPNAVLLSHHKNHYALIYAVRDWVEKVPIENNEMEEESSEKVNDGATTEMATNVNVQAFRKVRVRQVLTARRGQRPSAWIDWEELRGAYLKWAGYKLMTVRYSPYENVAGSSYSVGMHK